MGPRLTQIPANYNYTTWIMQPPPIYAERDDRWFGYYSVIWHLSDRHHSHLQSNVQNESNNPT